MNIKINNFRENKTNKDREGHYILRSIQKENTAVPAILNKYESNNESKKHMKQK